MQINTGKKKNWDYLSGVTSLSRNIQQTVEMKIIISLITNAFTQSVV